MLENAFTGTKRYYGLLAILAGIFALGFLFYLKQLSTGLGITGMGRDVSWGFYIAQFTYLVGVAASAVMVVLPYYLHNYKAFGRVTILGEFLAVSAVIMCVTFVLVDMGPPGPGAQRLQVPHSQLGHVLGYHRLERLSSAQYPDRLERAGMRTP